MARYKNDNEYLSIINNILENDDFKKMENIKHHNTTRLDHSIKVSYFSYKLAKHFGMDYKCVARAGLLHDFYDEEISKCNKIKDKVLLFSVKHPNIAVENAKNIVEINEKEEDIIKTHMFPVSNRVPKYAESWLVSIIDKILSTVEFSKKFKYQLTYAVDLYLLFIFNVIK